MRLVIGTALQWWKRLSLSRYTAAAGFIQWTERVVPAYILFYSVFCAGETDQHSTKSPAVPTQRQHNLDNVCDYRS